MPDPGRESGNSAITRRFTRQRGFRLKEYCRPVSEISPWLSPGRQGWTTSAGVAISTGGFIERTRPRYLLNHHRKALPQRLWEPKGAISGEALFVNDPLKKKGENDMKHFRAVAVISFLVLVFGGCAMYGNNGDLAGEGASGISYGRVKCPTCGFEFTPKEAVTATDLSEEGTSGVTYGRVKCSKCGFEFDAPAEKAAGDLRGEGASGISYGRVKCSKCGFEFDAPVKNGNVAE